MRRDQSIRHDQPMRRAKYFRSVRDYAVQLVTICGNIILDI